MLGDSDIAVLFGQFDGLGLFDVLGLDGTRLGDFAFGDFLRHGDALMGAIAQGAGDHLARQITVLCAPSTPTEAPPPLRPSA